MRDTRGGHPTVTELGAERGPATKIYGEAEKFYAVQPWIKVLLLGAESLETLRVTHANWLPDREPLLTVDA